MKRVEWTTVRDDKGYWEVVEDDTIAQFKDADGTIFYARQNRDLGCDQCMFNEEDNECRGIDTCAWERIDPLHGDLLKAKEMTDET